MKNEKQQCSVVNDKQEKHSEQTEYIRRRKIMIALWYRASQFLGPMWEAQFGTVEDDTIDAWQDALAKTSETQIAVGVKQLAIWTDRFPPTLGQFRMLCKAEGETETKRIEYKYDRKKARRAAKREIARMKQIVGRCEERLEENPESIEESLENLGMTDSRGR